MTGQIFLAGGGKEHNYPSVGGVFFKGTRKLLYIPLAWPNDDFKSCIAWFSEIVKGFGKIEFDTLLDAKQEINLKEYDGVFIGGGNTFKLLKRLKDGNLCKKLIKYYKKGGKVYGSSAGAIIFGYDINISTLCSDMDTNNVGLRNTKGMNITKNHDIQVHYTNNRLKENYRYLIKTKRNIVAIPEGTALVANGKMIQVIGENPATIITLAGITKYKPGDHIEL